jgi:hypothetical protein
MYSGTLMIDERRNNRADWTAFVEITDDRRVRLSRVGADPTAQQPLFDVPAREVRVSGGPGKLSITASGHTYTSNVAPQLGGMIIQNDFISANRHATASGINDWVLAFRRAGCRSRFVSYTDSLLLGVGVAVVLFVVIGVVVWLTMR